MIGVAALGSAVAMAGCCYCPGSTYGVRISPAFTPEQTETILAALDDWRAHVPVTFTVSSGTCGDDPQDQLICIKPDTHADITAKAGGAALATTTVRTGLDAEGGTGGFGGIDGGIVLMDPTLAPGTFAQAVAHELGHAMGLRHTSTWGALMYPSTAHAGTHVACDDVGQWWSVRGYTNAAGCQ